jgi:small GTP-binding protein
MQGEERQHDLSFKICILGTGSGKRQLLQVETESSELTDMRSDAAVSMIVKFYEINGMTCKVCYWDCPEAERHTSLTSRYCVGAAGVLFVYDSNDQQSFVRVENWVRELSKGVGTAAPRVLVGNKQAASINGDEGEEVTLDQAETFARKHNMQYIETMAETGANVNAAFEALLSDIVGAIPEPAEPSLLFQKAIKLGPKLLNNHAFKQSLNNR